MSGANQPHILSYNRGQFEQLCDQAVVPRVHAATLLGLLYRSHEGEQSDLAHQLPRKLMAQLKADFDWQPLAIASEVQSKYDGSVKFLIRLDDNNLVEAVLMPETSRLTLCISSQVGCMRACSFCSTGKMGLLRNLEVHEIVGQVSLAHDWLQRHGDSMADFTSQRRVTNVVFMGMGEPLDNLPALLQSLAIMTDPLGLNIAIRKIAVSTTGRLDHLETLIQAYPRIALAFSLHSPFGRQRSQIMPINRLWPLEEVLVFLKKHYPADDRARRFLLIQYVVLGGVNDSEEHAQKLSEVIEGIAVKINLIPYNEVDGLRFRAPEAQALSKFRDILHLGGHRVMIRYSKGQDIAGACGQLRTMYRESSASP